MCTAISYKTKNHYFGRTLDLEYNYDEKIVICPREFPFSFTDGSKTEKHYAMIGVASVYEAYPLYYDAANEMGLAMAGLSFPGDAYYGDHKDGFYNIAPYQLIPRVLSSCKNVAEARALLEKTNIVDIDFSSRLEASPLHWMISDKERSITVEAVKSGLQIYDNPIGVLTNDPPFEYHMTNLNNYMNLSSEPAEDRFSDRVSLEAYSKGMGAIGLPGDLSSSSRFVRAAFTKLNAVSGESEEESLSSFFHILGTVRQTKGCVHLGEGKYEITVYTSCCNTDKGIFYYSTYESGCIAAVDMHKEELDSSGLICYPLIRENQIMHLN